MTTRNIAIISLIVISLAGVVYALRGHYIDRPVAENPHMQLAPYRDGMSLRQAYETFPRFGAGPARLRLLVDNGLAWAARWELLHAATDNIDVSYFILSQDVFGAAFLGHLLHKAEAGVQVRILLDAFGSKLSWHPEGNDYLDTLVNNDNIEVRIYRPLLDRAMEGLMTLSAAVTVASEHDKILVVDQARAITGGRNIATEYFAHPDDAETVFHDVGVEIADHGIATALGDAFAVQYDSDSAEPVRREILDLQSQRRDLDLAYRAMDAWLRGTPLPPDVSQQIQELGLDWDAKLARLTHLQGSLAKPFPAYVEAETRVLDSTTRYKAPDDIISQAASRLVKSARQEIFIQNPYIVVPDEAIGVFAAASQHAVPIILFTNSPESTDSVVSQAFFLEQWRYLLAGIPTLQLYGNAEQEMIHSKLATFDGVLSLVGTYNLSPLSMATNSEVVLAVWSRTFAERLTAKPRASLARGQPHVYRYRIERNEDGSVRRDEAGEPISEFGPQDHSDLQDDAKLQAAWKALKAAQMLLGVSPFF